MDNDRDNDNDIVSSHAISTPYPGSEMVWQDHQYCNKGSTTGLMDLPSLITDRCHSLFWSHLQIIQRYNSFTSKALHLSIDGFTGTPPATDWKGSPDHPQRTCLQQGEDMGLPISACQFATSDHSLSRSLRPSASQAQQWVSEWVNTSWLIKLLLLLRLMDAL